MRKRISLLRRLASVLIAHAFNVFPSGRAPWGEAMKHELDYIEGDIEAMRWALGCVAASYVQRSREHPRSFGAIVRHPSALLPLAMSIIALAVVLSSVAMFGVVHESDEGAAAHIWQLLMAGQMPVLAFFAIKWLPRAPRQTLYVLALQTGAILAAMAPVFFLHL
jgi:hypothetical protein